MQTSLGQAADAQIIRIIAMVDAMPRRGAAEALIAPLRARLAQLRPARTLDFTRLLFTPLEPLLVHAKRWRRGNLGIPRTALPVLGAALRAALAPIAGEVDHVLAATPRDSGTMAAAGAILWPAAAAALEQLAIPADWSDRSDLMYDDYPGIAAMAAALLHEASAIERIAASCKEEDAAILAMLARSEARGGNAATAVMAALLTRVPAPERVIALMAESGRATSRLAAEGALDHTLDCLETSVNAAADGTANLPQFTQDVARTAALLKGLETAAAGRPDRRRQLEQIRRGADQVCRECFQQAVTLSLAQLSALGEAGHDDAVATLEAGARDLRRLETAGRRLGGNEQYDAMLQRAAAPIRDGGSALSLTDRVHLLEILAGPEAALALLATGR